MTALGRCIYLVQKESQIQRGACRLECIVPVTSSEATNLGLRTKISQSQPLTSFEPRSFEMTGSWPFLAVTEVFGSRHKLAYEALILTEISRPACITRQDYTRFGDKFGRRRPSGPMSVLFR